MQFRSDARGRADASRSAAEQLSLPRISRSALSPATSACRCATDYLRKLAREQEAAIIAVTHDEKIYDHLDRIYKLRDGQLVETEERATA